jgi:hypothetical protein
MGMSTIIDGSAGVTTNAGGSVNPSTNVDGINYSCRAWVNFNGTGTVAIRGSGNVTSITDVGTGNYTVNITTAMTDTNFCVNATSNENTSGAGSLAIKGGSALTTTTVGILTITPSSIALVDSSFVFVSVFR